MRTTVFSAESFALNMLLMRIVTCSKDSLEWSIAACMTMAMRRCTHISARAGATSILTYVHSDVEQSRSDIRRVCLHIMPV